jgi:hypothetical protein
MTQPAKISTATVPHNLTRSALRFRSVIKINNVNPYVLVTARQAARLKKNWRKPLPVRIRVNGQPKTSWRINLMPIGDGSFYLYLHGDVRMASGTKVGDAVTVEVQFDDAYKNGPMHPMPPWFDDVLNQNPRARQSWDALIPSRQKEILRYFASLKSPEAQVRNLQRAIHVLSGGQARFMGRSWNEERG